jgi:hypothetical protein
MRRYVWSRMMVGLCLATAVACTPPTPFEEEAGATIAPLAAESPAPENTVTAAPQRTIVPTRALQPTHTPEPLTPQPGWRGFGDERVGLRLTAPDSWLEALRLPEAIDLKLRVGRHSLLLVDTADTALNLLAGTAVGSGLFVMAFISPLTLSAEPDWQPETALADLLADWQEEESDDSPPVIPVRLQNFAAAYSDLDFIPFDLFPPNEQPLRLRLVLVNNEALDAPVVLLLGAAEVEWPDYETTLTTILNEIRLYPVEITPIAGELRSGDQVNGRLAQASTGVWAFRGESGRYATITLIPGDSSLDLTLTLVDPSGRTVETMDSGYAGDNELLADVLLSETGLYLIEAREFFAEDGPYRLMLALTDEPQFGGGGRIAMGEEILRDLPPKGEHAWTFNAVAGQTISIVLTPLGNQLDLILELRGPDQRQIALRDEGFSGDPEVLVGQNLTVTGEYVILVRGFAGHGGPYRLSLDEGGESTLNFWEAGDIAYQESKREVLRANEAHAWYFQGAAGDEVTITATPLDNRLDLELWLLDPEVNELVIKDDWLLGEAETIVYTLPVDGQYIILARDFFGQSGAYELSLTASGLNFIEPMGWLPFDEPVMGTLSEGKRASWTFDGRQNDQITLDLTPLTPASDLVIILLTPTGETAVVVDQGLAGSAERLQNFTLTENGVWTVIVQEFFDGGGEYTLLLTRLRE